jgi:hypothetical protein
MPDLSLRIRTATPAWASRREQRVPDKRDMHKAKSKGRHKPGPRSGGERAAAAAGGRLGGAEASAPVGFGAAPATGAAPGKKGNAHR